MQTVLYTVLVGLHNQSIIARYTTLKKRYYYFAFAT